MSPPFDLQLTNDWFDRTSRPVWDELVPAIRPSRILEIGSFEGASIVYLIDKLAPHSSLEIHCIDTWGGGVEHQGADMQGVERRFRHNTAGAVAAAPNPVDLVVHRGLSDLQLAGLLVDGKSGYFDYIYVDGSHQAPDVLCDAVLAFKLLRVGGVMAFDDYLWSEDLPEGKDPLRCPKPAIDAFVNLNFRKLRVLNFHLYQLYILKTAD